MSIPDPWTVEHIHGSIAFSNYLAGQASGGHFQSAPAKFQRKIEWDEDNVRGVLLEMFPSSLDHDLLVHGRRALDDAKHFKTHGRTAHKGTPFYEAGTGLPRVHLHDIALQAMHQVDDRMVHIIDGQQRTTFWRLMMMFLIEKMIELDVPTIPRSVAETMFVNSRTMTCGDNSAYDRLSEPFCMDLRVVGPVALANAKTQHQQEFSRQDAQRPRDPMTTLYRETKGQMGVILQRIANCDTGLAGDMEAAVYAVARRVLFDCEVCIKVLPRQMCAGLYYYTKNSRGEPLSEHALIKISLSEYDRKAGRVEGDGLGLADRWDDLTARMEARIATHGRKTSGASPAPEMMCHAAVVAILCSHQTSLISAPAECLSALSTCQKKSAGNAFKAISVLDDKALLDAVALVDKIDELMDVFAAVHIDAGGSSAAVVPGVDRQLLEMFKSLGGGSAAHAVMVSHALGCSAQDTAALMRGLVTMIAINKAHETAGRQDLVPQIGRVGATLNHAIASNIKRAVRADGMTENSTFAMDLLADLVGGSDGSSPYYDEKRTKEVLSVLPRIVFGLNNGLVRCLMRQDWHARHGEAADLRNNDIEHMLPVTPCALAVIESGVQGVDPENAKDDKIWANLVGLIGNRVWLPLSTNRACGNRSFSQKKKDLKLRLAKGCGQGPDATELVGMKRFGVQEISARGEQMTLRIGNLWKQWIDDATPKTQGRRRGRAANDARIAIEKQIAA